MFEFPTQDMFLRFLKLSIKRLPCKHRAGACQNSNDAKSQFLNLTAVPSKRTADLNMIASRQYYDSISRIV